MRLVEVYRRALRRLPDRGVASWDGYLRQESRLPGPRANLAVLHAAVDEGDAARFRYWRDLDRGAEDDPDEFLCMCGVVGLGQDAAATFDRARRVPDAMRRELRRYANDPRWRVRDAAAMALQRIGDTYLRPLLEIAEDWAHGNAFEQRAAVAAVCETRFTTSTKSGAAERIVAIVDQVTAVYAASNDRGAPGAVSLRNALSYGWSIVLAANPTAAARFDRWVAQAAGDADLRHIVVKNCAEARVQRALPDAVARWESQISRLGTALESRE